MNIKEKRVILIIGAISAFITILIFLLDINNGKQPIDYASLIFILLGEGLFFGTIAYISQSTIISRFAVSSVAVVYLLINIIFSILLNTAFQNNVFAFSAIHIILIGITALIILILSGVLNQINKDEEETIKQKAVIDECERMAAILTQNCKFDVHKPILNQIYSEIKYNDHISDYKSSEILSALNAIYVCSDNNEFGELCSHALQLVQDRNITVKQLKRGGF